MCTNDSRSSSMSGYIAPQRMRGNALFLVAVFLLMASVFVLFAMNVGRFEQKTSGNDVRAKLAQELAEAGLHQGIEYFNANRSKVTDASQWTACASSDTSFPCGAVQEFAADGTTHRRDTMMKFTGGTGNGSVQIALPQQMTREGDYSAAQQVGAVVCWVKRTSGTSTECTTDRAEASTTWLLTVVSKGSLTDEGASATMTQTIGAYNVFSLGTNIPPVVASGSVTTGGGLQIVTSPNAGGTGVPVSVWTRLDMGTSGTPNTCYLDEFLRQGGTSDAPRMYDGIAVCDTCACESGSDTSDSLSYNKGSQRCLGMDIVDIDGNTANPAGCPAANLDIRRSEFPKDLFAFIFGQQAWNDTNQGTGGDTYANKEFNFAEARRISSCTYPDPASGASVTAILPEDTCYLLNIKNKVHIGDGINDAAECAAIGESSSGIIWIHSQSIAGASTLPGYDCSTTIKNLDQIGTPSHPVALIWDGSLTQVHFKLFGLLFVRSPNGTATLDDETGGDANLSLNGGAAVYGAVVVQGQITSGGGGTASIIYNEKVLSNLINDPENESPAALPGSWTDRLRY